LNLLIAQSEDVIQESYAMKKSCLLLPALTGIFTAGLYLTAGGASAQQPVQDPQHPPENPVSSRPMRETDDPLRKCTNTALMTSDAPKEGELLMPATSWGNNPQEQEYRKEIERLLRLEIGNVHAAIGDVENKHKQLILLYPELSKYQEIILEDIPGAWRDGVFVNSKRTLSLHYNEKSELVCMVLDSFTRSVYFPEQWTRKIIRLYNKNVQMMELETLRHNFHLPETLQNTSPEIQLKGLRLVYSNLRTALYSMDMLIAAYYDLRNKRNEWQINL